MGKYDLSIKQLIEMKENRLKRLRSKHFDLLSYERALKNVMETLKKQ